MKIIVTSQSSALGGVERRLESEVFVLRSLNWDVVVSLPEFLGKKAWQMNLENLGCSFVKWNPYKFIERSHSSFPMRWPLSPSKFLMRRIKPDAAHVALPWTVTGMSRVAQFADLGIPVVLGLHCTYPPQTFNLRDRKNIKNALAGVVGAYAVSESVKQSFLKNFSDFSDHFSVQVIPNGIDCKKFSAKYNISLNRKLLRESLGVGEEDLLIVFCGRMEEMKRPDFAVRAMAQDSIKGQRIKMLMLGDGPLLPFLKEYAATFGVDKNISFLGFVKKPEEYYKIADFYVSTSSASEGFGLSVGEALASGLPCLLPDNRVFRECFSDCRAVRFFEFDSMERFTSEILSICRFSKAHMIELSKSAVEYAEDKLDASIMLNRLETFYLELQNSLT